MVQNYTFLGKVKLLRADIVSLFMNTPGIKFCQNRSWFRGCAKALKISNIPLQPPLLMIFSNVTDPIGLAYFPSEIKFLGEIALYTF